MAASPAHSGAWVQEKGQGILISGLLLSEASSSLDRDGNREPGLYFSKYESSFYAEYGLSDRLTLVLQLAGQRVSQDNNGITDTAEGLAASRAGVQAHAFDAGRWVFAAQAAAVIPGGGENVADRPLGDGANGLELRALAGRPIGTNGFLDLQIARTWRDNDYPSETRLDTTLGWRIREQYLLLAQSFYIAADPDIARTGREFSQHKIQFSAGRRIRGRQIMIGAFTTVSGRNAIDESGVLISWWRRF